MNRQQVVEIIKQTKQVSGGWKITPHEPDVFQYKDIYIETTYNEDYNLIRIECEELVIDDKEILASKELWQKELAEFLISKDL